MSLLLLFALTLQLTATNISSSKEVVRTNQQQGQGILYIDPLPPSASYMTEGKGSSPLEGYDDSITAREERMKKSYANFIEIVGVKKVKITQNEPVTIKGLNPTKKYLLKVYAADGKTTLTAFHFSFKARGADKLRLSYNPFYTSWRLDVMKR